MKTGILLPNFAKYRIIVLVKQPALPEVLFNYYKKEIKDGSNRYSKMV